MSEPSNGTGLREHVLLFSRFLRSPRTVGALTASSRALAEAMVAGLDLSGPCRIVELGPGTGVFTAAIVERIGPETKFLAMDIEPAFVRQIRKRWPAVDCVCASAECLDAIAGDRDMLPVDHIVSGLPFVSLPPQVTRQILERVALVLRPGGTFTTFQYLPGYGLPSAVSFRRSMTARLGAGPSVRLVVRNVPPALVLTWKKKLTSVLPALSNAAD
ncbi:MAG: methyltransferase domain-containing protein [Vicinamibacterales bacterium]